MVMTIRVMSSGKGYEYLLHSVVVGDGDREMSSPLTRYYTETGNPPGTWVGTGLTSLDDGRSSALAESDTVTEEHLARLLGEGIHQVTEEKLGRRFPALQPPRERIAARIARLAPDLRGDTREETVQRIREEELAKTPRTAVAGFDLTFSPPKSLSAIWDVADAGTQALIAQAHHAAMRDTIAMLEDRVAATRVGAGGIAQMPITGVIATAFDHDDSRAADPQLHTHVVVSNKVQGEDGRWRTLDSRRLHKATVALSASYNAFLTDHTARLLGVAWTPVDRGKDRNTGWEIQGVPAALTAEFSPRTTGGSDGVEGIEQVSSDDSASRSTMRRNGGVLPAPTRDAISSVNVDTPCSKSPYASGGCVGWESLKRSVTRSAFSRKVERRSSATAGFCASPGSWRPKMVLTSIPLPRNAVACAAESPASSRRIA